MKLRHRLATEIRRELKAVHKRLEAEETKEYEAKGEEATENADPTTMYFERWGLLAPPPEKSELSKNLLAQLFPIWILYLITCQCATCGVLAYWRARNCPSFPLNMILYDK